MVQKPQNLHLYLTLPVKLIPARCVELVTVSPNTRPCAGIKLMMPAGRPASGYKNLETYLTLPVKLIPARCGELVTVSPNTGPSAGTKLMMPAGRPASRYILYTK